MGDASLNAGETCGGVEESSEELSGVASSESPEADEKKRDQIAATGGFVVVEDTRAL